MPKNDYSTWLTKQQAADAIGVSTKTLEKIAVEKKFQQQYWKRPETGATVAVYHPDDVNRIRLERNPDAEPFVLTGAEPTKALAPAAGNRLLEGFLQSLAQETSQNSQSGAVLLVNRVFLTMGEAVCYSGLGERQSPQVDRGGHTRAAQRRRAEGCGCCQALGSGEAVKRLIRRFGIISGTFEELHSIRQACRMEYSCRTVKL